MAELTRRQLFKTTGGAAAAVAAVLLGGSASGLFSGPAQTATIAWNHNPASL